MAAWLWGSASRVLCMLLPAAMLAACLPQTLVTQPQLTMHIQNKAGEAIPAAVTLYWWEYPHHRQRDVSVVSTDAQGTVTFAETTATEMLMPFAPHGVPAYNWSFCIESNGYKTLIGTINNVTRGDEIDVRLTLHPGESLAVCDDFARLANHRGAPVEDAEFSGGTLVGLYEVNDALE